MLQVPTMKSDDSPVLEPNAYNKPTEVEPKETSTLASSSENSPPGSSMEVEPFVAQDVPSDRSETGACGLYNLGNTCYMNSALQCLLHEEMLQEYFLSSELRLKDASLIRELTELYKKYWSGKWSSVVPRKFKKQVELIHSQFVGSGQHDGQEFLALVLASLHQELKKMQEDGCSGDSFAVNDEKNVKRKRTNSYIDDSMPNNKRIDSSALNKEYLSITSLIGKEKKTANVNVLNADVECDEEITTDHSKKFSQVSPRPFPDDVVTNRVLNNQLEQRRKSFDRTNFVEQIKDLQLRQLKHPSCKQTNVIADIKRHVAEKERHSSTESASSDKYNIGLSSEEKMDCKEELCTSSKETMNKISLVTSAKLLNDCTTSDGEYKALSSNLEQTESIDDEGKNCSCDDVDDVAVRTSTPELADASEELQDTASNIRGDICAAKPNQYVADEMWQKYLDQNRTIVVDTLQGQMESTVVCCQCSHKSTTYEPFMYLSVPIPHALQKIYSIRVVPLHDKPASYSVYALREGRIECLMESLTEQIKQSSSTRDLSSYVLCEVKNFRILKVLENNSILKSVNTTSRSLEAIEFLSKVSEPGDSQVQSAWNSCCICLEELSDSELLKHDAESCSILICHTCLQNSTEHYGLNNFSCPICHAHCDPAVNFVPLASANQSRDVVVSVNFLLMDGDTVNFLAPSKLLRTATSISARHLHAYLQELIPDFLKSVSYSVVFCSIDGASCSRCDVTASCSGCFRVTRYDGDLTLHPGDNIGLRFSEVPDSKQEIMSAEEDVTSVSETQVTLEMCLSAFTQKEVLDDGNPWFCPSCQSHQLAEKRLRICRWPSTLIVYIKRFLYHSKTAVKVDDAVVFPVEEFEPGPISGTDAEFAKTYDLNSCVSHYGGVYSGHYTSCCRHPTNGKWYLYNDETVSRHDPSAKDSSSVYILFYKEKNFLEI